MNPWVAYCDGSAVPNPGRIGLGAVLTEPDGTRHLRATSATDCLVMIAAVRPPEVAPPGRDGGCQLSSTRERYCR